MLLFAMNMLPRSAMKISTEIRKQLLNINCNYVLNFFRSCSGDHREVEGSVITVWEIRLDSCMTRQQLLLILSSVSTGTELCAVNGNTAGT